MNVAFVKGLGLGLGLIVAIGAQNAFVLTNSLRKNHITILVLGCILFDLLGITLGIAGLGTIISENTFLVSVTTWGGVAFLSWYGFSSFRSAFNGQSLSVETEGEKPGRKKIFISLMGVTFLNPHYYLDTVVLIGTIAGQYSNMDRFFFWGGASLSSVLWFSCLGFGSVLLIPLFKKPLTWKVLDVLIGCTMWFIAYGLIRSAMV